MMNAKDWAELVGVAALLLDHRIKELASLPCPDRLDRNCGDGREQLGDTRGSRVHPPNGLYPLPVRILSG